jgi:hypothetical protein
MNLSMSIINFLLALGLCFVLASCKSYTHEELYAGGMLQSKKTTYRTLGTDAGYEKASAEEYVAYGTNQSKSFEVAGKTASSMTGIITAGAVMKAQSADEVAKHKATETGTTTRAVAGEETTRALAVEETKRAMIEPPIPAP